MTSILETVSYNESEIFNEFSQKIIAECPILDVRAPIEFIQGALPGSVNLPILDDEEREKIGIIYKSRGQAEAIASGNELVSGKKRQNRIEAWARFLRENPNSYLTCFRGGLRSKTAQQWLQAEGLVVPRLDGGYKKARNFLMGTIDRFSSEREFLLISGPTGSGKTILIRDLVKQNKKYGAVDLEYLANHKGSAFGKGLTPQPSQSDFENRLAKELLRIYSDFEGQYIWPIFEDESRMIGKSVLPIKFFEAFQRSPIVFVDEPMESRARVIFEEYILASPLAGDSIEAGLLQFARFETSLQAISRKLGGAKFSEISSMMANSKSDFLQHQRLESNLKWIGALLEFYYDPLYLNSLARRNAEVLFRGPRIEATQWLENKMIKLMAIRKNAR